MSKRIKRGHGYVYACDYCGAIHSNARHADDCCSAFHHLYTKLDGVNVLKSTGKRWR